MSTRKKTSSQRNAVRRMRSRRCIFDDPAFTAFARRLARTSLHISDEQIDVHYAAATETAYAAAEKAAVSCFREAVPTGVADELDALRLKLAAMIGLMFALQDDAPSAAEAAGFLITVDDRIELFEREVRDFYDRFYRRATIHPTAS